MKSCVLAILVIMIFCITVTNCEPDPMARPTRPKVFTSPEQFKQYVDNLKDYYSLSGHARYGKRAGGVASPAVYLGYPWDTMKYILDTHRRFPLQKEEKDKLSKGQVFRDFQVFRNSPPVNFNDANDKYYDDME